jgi:hypothetical protein
MSLENQKNPNLAKENPSVQSHADTVDCSESDHGFLNEMIISQN